MEYSFGIDELKSNENRFWQAIIAEFFGNLILNFFACGACTQPEGGLFKALAFGLAIFVAICIIGELSGGHVNPAVTIALFAIGRVSLLRAALYIIAQCLGSIAGTLALRTLIDDVYHNGLGHTTLAPNVTPLQGFGLEFFLGFVLVLTVFGVCDPNKRTKSYTAPLAIGMAVALGHLGTLRYTGASMNPARTLGTALATDNWTAHWVYWAGPVAGGIAAAFLYVGIIAKPYSELTLPRKDKYRAKADAREKQGISKTYQNFDLSTTLSLETSATTITNNTNTNTNTNACHDTFLLQTHTTA